MKYSLPVLETISEAWQKTYGAKGTFVIAIIILVAIILVFEIILYIILYSVPENMAATYHLINLIYTIVTLLLQTGIIYIGLKRAFDLPISYSMIFRAFETNLAFRIIIATFLQMLIIWAPLLPLVFFPIFWHS